MRDAGNVRSVDKRPLAGRERRSEMTEALGRWARVERGHAIAETPHQCPSVRRQRPGGVERGAPAAGHAERRVEQHHRLRVRGDGARGHRVPEQQDERQNAGRAQRGESGTYATHANASARVNFASCSARPTIAPANPAARAARRSSSEAMPPDTITSSWASSVRAPVRSGPSRVPSRDTLVYTTVRAPCVLSRPAGSVAGTAGTVTGPDARGANCPLRASTPNAMRSAP